MKKIETINYKQIHDFIKCPLLYKFKYVDKINTDKRYIREKIQKTLRETIKEFYRVIEEEKRVMDFDELKIYWSDIYYEGKGKEEILFINSNRRQRQTDKVSKFLSNFYDRYKDNPGVTVGIDIPYKIKTNSITIKGKIPIVREIDSKVDILFLDYRSYNPDEFRADNYLFFTLLSFAYRNVFDKKEDSITYYNATKDKLIKVSRDEKDYKKALNQISNIANIINNNLYYQRYDHECKGCPYQKECTNWKGV